MTTEQKIDGYLEINEKISRMTDLIERWELQYFQEHLQKNIMSPLLDDGFQEDDIVLFLKVAIHKALAGKQLEHNE